MPPLLPTMRTVFESIRDNPSNRYRSPRTDDPAVDIIFMKPVSVAFLVCSCSPVLVLLRVSVLA